nr:MAG TPA: hypothetical protein [Crassvirales sp.]
MARSLANFNLSSLDIEGSAIEFANASCYSSVN